MTETRSRAGCWIAAALGCVVLVVGGGLMSAGVAFWLLRTTPAPAPVPVATASDPEPPATEPTATAPTAAGEGPEPAEDDEPDLDLSTKHEPYIIRGQSAEELRRQMNELGPTDSSGRHDAYTRWYVRWSFPYDKSAESCGLGKVTVEVTITYILPEWSAPPDASADLVARWNRYAKALRIHEDGHRDHGVEAGREVLRKLRSQPARASCDEANRDANATARRVIDEHKAKDLGYDRTTRHGATQGATFP